MRSATPPMSGARSAALEGFAKKEFRKDRQIETSNHDAVSPAIYPYLDVGMEQGALNHFPKTTDEVFELHDRHQILF